MSSYNRDGFDFENGHPGFGRGSPNFGDHSLGEFEFNNFHQAAGGLNPLSPSRRDSCGCKPVLDK